LEMAKPGTIERHLPDITSGILKIEMRIRLEKKPTVDNLHWDSKYAKKPYIPAGENYRLIKSNRKLSCLKVYAANENNRWAYRWHYPFAWWEIDGNSVPQFYICEGRGSKKKGMEYTGFTVTSGRWYTVTTVLNFGTKTWEFWVDGTKFDYPTRFGREMAWWHKSDKLNKIRITNAALGRNWIDSIRVFHNGRLIAVCGFDSDGGYENGKSVVGKTKPE